MDRRERYRTDPVYRAEVNARNKAQYHKDMTDPVKRKLRHLRARINNAKIAIEHHQARIKFFQSRLMNDARQLVKITNAMHQVKGNKP